MEPRKRTHLVNELMDEAQLMMAALEKAMEGERIEETFPAKHGTHHPEEQYSLARLYPFMQHSTASLSAARTIRAALLSCRRLFATAENVRFHRI